MNSLVLLHPGKHHRRYFPEQPPVVVPERQVDGGKTMMRLPDLPLPRQPFLWRKSQLDDTNSQPVGCHSLALSA